MYGEMFWSALESAAFVVSDPKTLIRIGLNMIPIHSQISRVIKEALWCQENGLRWAEAREKIVTFYGHYSPCNAIPNHGFIMLGLLYGQDFGDKLCKAVNCGYDTDCTGATLGSLLGIIDGTKGIPKKWKEPIGEKIILHKFTHLDGAPNTVAELTERVGRIADKILFNSERVKFGNETVLPENHLTLLMENEMALKALSTNVHSSVKNVENYQIWLYYNGDPVIYPRIGKVLGIRVLKDGKPVNTGVELLPPNQWDTKEVEESLGQKRFVVTTNKPSAKNKIVVAFGKRVIDFTILGPDEAHGYPSGVTVPTCTICGGYLSSCICPHKRS